MKWKRIDERGWPTQWITTETAIGFYVIEAPASSGGKYHLAFAPKKGKSSELGRFPSLEEAQRAAERDRDLPSVHAGKHLFNVHGPGQSYGYSHDVRADNADEAVEKLKARGMTFRGFYSVDRVVNG